MAGGCQLLNRVRHTNEASWFNPAGFNRRRHPDSNWGKNQHERALVTRLPALHAMNIAPCTGQWKTCQRILPTETLQYPTDLSALHVGKKSKSERARKLCRRSNRQALRPSHRCSWGQSGNSLKPRCGGKESGKTRRHETTVASEMDSP